MLILDDIHIYYGDSYVLQGVSLHVEHGTVVALLGRNGMGKTTTIHSVMGFLVPRKGSIRFKGQEIAGSQSHKIARCGIGLVPQGRRIFPSLTVEENLTMAARTGRGSSPWTLSKIYELFPILGDRCHLKGTLLSGGEQSLLSIGRALMTNPDLLLMDEPSEGLAPVVVSMVAKTIEQLKSEGISILLVEQNLPLATKLADYVYIMENGNIACKTENSDPEIVQEMITEHICV